MILSKKAINLHLKIFALDQPPFNTHPQTPLKKLNLLASTRRFHDIAAAAKNAKDVSFPNLEANLKKSEEESQKKKNALEASKVFEKLKEFEAMSKESDPNFELIDAGLIKIFTISKILFEEGKYSECLQILKELQKQDLQEELWLKVTWARIYCEILLKQDALKTLERLKKKIDELEVEELEYLTKNKLSTEKLLKKLYIQKEEFLLLSLFVVFRQGGDEQLQKFVDFCTNDKSYFSVLQLTCPEMLRYVTVAIILNKTLQNNRTFDLFKLSEVINRKYIKYSDCFSEYISSLQVEYDFEAATQKIEECKQSIKKDIFLAPFQKKLVEGLNFLYFKRLCKIYDTIELKEITSFTGLSAEQAELWILSYIRSGDIDAKIDSIAELIVSNKGKQNPYEKYMDVVPNLGGLVNSLSRAITNQ